MVLSGAVRATEHKSRDYSVLIGECTRDSVPTSMHEACYLAVSMDASTDSSVVEKELICNVHWV